MRRILPLLALSLLACSDIVTPLRTGAYEYRKFVAEEKPSERVDTFTFHWPRAFLPVRVWVDANDPLYPHVARAIRRWTGAFLYGEFDAELVSDSLKADVIVLNAQPPAFVSGALRMEAFAPECRGATDIPHDPATNIAELPFRIYIYSRFAPDPPGLATCYSITATHELGHALGLLEHSPSPTDLMFADPALDGIGDQDRITAETLYHLPSRLTPGTRR